MSNAFHPDLRRAARFFPRMTVSPRLLAVVRFLMRLAPSRRIPDVDVQDLMVPRIDAPPVRIRLYRPKTLASPAPALLWIHGGGYIAGRPEQDDQLCAANARDLGIVIASVDYRLAPEHPFPAPLEDCYAALCWLFAHAAEFGVEPSRIAIGGASAGGGLAAALAQLAHDRNEVKPVFQLLIYPMLDDRTAIRTDIDGENHRGWNHGSNVFGWRSYLARAPGGPDVPKYGAAARREDLAGLPPAWLGVGTCDLFHDEDCVYARRLEQCGVACEVVVVPGAFHAFDLMCPDASVSRDFRASYLAALRRALFATSARGDVARISE